MNAELLLHERHVISDDRFVELVVWRVPTPVTGSHHGFKYRLALVVDGRCMLRYDNEPGKGDHVHRGEEEQPYHVTSPRALLDDFWKDVDNWR